MVFDPAILAGLSPELVAFIVGLVERVERLEAENAALKVENAALRAENAELKRRLGMNSSNSSKPPSTDTKSNSRPERRVGSAKKRGKSDRKGTNRNDFGPPDLPHVPVRAEACPDCDGALAGEGVFYDRRQVAELVDKPFVVTEFEFYRRFCPCCAKWVEAPTPEGTLPGFCLGPRMVAFIGVLDHFGNVTQNKVATILQEGFNLPICEGTLDNAKHWMHSALAAPVAELQEALPKVEHAHIDETGWRIDGAKYCLWAIATLQISFLYVAATKGANVLVKLLGKAFNGLISCDFAPAYRAADGVGGERSFCWSHLDREAKGIIDNGSGDAADFGRDIRYIVHWGYIHWRGLMRGRITERVFQLLGERHKSITRDMLEFYNGKLLGDKKANALHKRLGEHLDGYFNWYRYPGVEPDNNSAERTIRPSVINRKVSGGNRSQWGAELTSYMQTVIGTCRKQGMNVMDSLQAYLLAFAHPGRTYPSLVPSDMAGPPR